MFQDIAYIYNDYMTEDTSAPVAVSAHQCCESCLADSRCYGWVYNPFTGAVSIAAGLVSSIVRLVSGRLGLC